MYDLTEETKKSLDIDHINDTDLDFSGIHKSLEFYKHTDGDLEISIDDYEINTYILTNDQIKILINWLFLILNKKTS